MIIPKDTNEPQAKRGKRPRATAPASEPAPWRNRIVGYTTRKASEFVANPSNWRIHPKEQQAALTGILREVGIVQNVIENATTGNLVDGHARVLLAMDTDEELPVTVVELTEDEERKILAVLDPLAALAGRDQEQLDALLAEVSTEDEGLQALLDSLVKKFPPVQPEPQSDPAPAGCLTCPQCGYEMPATPVKMVK